MDRVQAMKEWSNAIGSLWQTVLNEGEGFKSDENASQFTPGGASGMGWNQSAMGGKAGRPKGKGPGRQAGVVSKG